MADRKARLTDLAQIALGLPDVQTGTAWGDRPAYTVHGKAFVMFREPRPDAVDPDTGDRMDDVIVVSVPDLSDKEALVASDSPWFTTSHFDGYKAVLVRARDLPLVSRAELAEVLTDAWTARAPRTLVKAFLADGGPPG